MNTTRKVALVCGTILFGWVLILSVLLVAAINRPDGADLVIPEDYSQPFDAKPGDTLSLVMLPGGDPEARCEDAGGTIAVVQGVVYCDDVDF